MALYEALRKYIGKSFKYNSIKKVKDVLRPLKHAMIGRNGFYKALQEAQRLTRFKHNREIQCCFDIGAAIGEATLPMLRDFPNAHIYSFEPQPEQYLLLKKRIPKVFHERCHFFNLGLYNNSGNMQFFIHKYRDSSSFLPLSVAEDENKLSHKIEVQVRRLDDLMKEFGDIGIIDFMKIDVEGVEKEVIEGMLETIRERVDSIFCEISPLRKGWDSHDYIDVFKLLHGAGFYLYGVYGDFFFTKIRIR